MFLIRSVDMSTKNMHIYKPKEFFKLLNELGFYFHHKNSSHKIFANKEGYFVTIPDSGNKQLNGAMTKLALQRIERKICSKLDFITVDKYRKEFYKESGYYI